MILKLIRSSVLIALLLLSFLGPVERVQANTQPLYIVLAPGQNKIDAAVNASLDSLQSGETLTVIVQLRQRANLSEGNGSRRHDRLVRVIRLLKATANGTQGPLKTLLKARMKQGHVKNFTAFWILNGFSVTADAATINELAAQPDVLSISPDTIDIIPVSGAVPDLSNPEQNITLVSAPALWSLGYTGQGTVIASMDTGVDLNQPELAARWRGGTNSWFDPFGQHPNTPVDLNGHGSWTMGVAVGGDAGGTSIGVAPAAQWISVKIFNDQGGSTASAIHQGYQWLLDPDNDPATDDAPQVINNSWAFGGPGCNLEFEPDLQALRAAGILPVFAAGNYGSSSSTSTSPANNPSAFAIGAINNNGLIYSLSSRGPTNCGGSTGVFPQLVAPGVNVDTTDLGGFYTAVSGTSLSAPHVAGGLALLLSAYPDLTASQQESALISSAVDLGPAGPDNTYGFGRLNLAAALSGLASPVTETPTPQLDPATTETLTDVPTVAATPSQTPTILPTDTPTAMPTFTPTSTLTHTATALPTFTSTLTATYTATPLPTLTSTPTATHTATALPTSTATRTATALPTFTSTATKTSTSLPAPTSTSASAGQLYFSTLGNSNPPGVSGTADDADIYLYNGTAFSRSIDVSTITNPLPSTANVDGFDRVDATHFYMSFNGSFTISLPGPDLTVQDEDVVYYNAGAWSLYFDGSAQGLSGTDLDAISMAGGVLYFSTDDTDVPPGVSGSGDDADIYSWNGTSFARVVDASSAPYSLPGSANADGFVRLDATHFYVSFNADTTAPSIGAVQDEDILYYNNGTWSVYFDGTAKGLTSSNLDLDAFDFP